MIEYLAPLADTLDLETKLIIIQHELEIVNAYPSNTPWQVYSRLEGAIEMIKELREELHGKKVV